jgi:polygalacturonase
LPHPRLRTPHVDGWFSLCLALLLSASCSAGGAETGGGGGTHTGGGGTGAAGGRVAAGGGMPGTTTGMGGRPSDTAGSAGSGRTGSAGDGGVTATGGAFGGGNATGSAGNGDVIGPGGAGDATGSGGSCGSGDPNLPPEPSLPTTICATLAATQAVSATGLPSESKPDTSAIQAALNACGSGSAVKLVTAGSNNAFLTGPIKVPSGTTLWVDAGVTLFGTRDPKLYGSASALITVTGSGSGIAGDGTIDGQGGEPKVGSTQSWWDANNSGGESPALIQVTGASKFTLYRITLHNAPMFHVKLSADGFLVWGVTIKTPSRATNSAGTALAYSNAHNTDGIDPGESASNGYIVCSLISDGDDHIAIKGSSSTGVTNVTIAHDHLEAGHGISIGSEFTGGVSGINVYDISIDGTGTGTSGGNSNGLRIKSDSSRGGLVNNVTYSDICMRDLSNPILLTPHYSSASGNKIPQYTNIKFSNIHVVPGGSNAPTLTFDGYDASHTNSVTLDNVVVEASPVHVEASYTAFTLGPGVVSFTPAGTGVTVTNKVSNSSPPNPCTDKWVTF